MKHLHIDKPDTLQPEHVHITATNLDKERVYKFDMMYKIYVETN